MYTNGTQNMKLTSLGDSYMNFANGIVLKGNAILGDEDISLQGDTLVKGSNASATTSGLSVTNSTNASLLEIKNNGVINASNLPTSSVGLSSGDIWNNAGVLNIV